MTEKIHGTWMAAGYHPDAPHHIVTSKGLSGQGLAFKLNEANINNLYIRALDGTAPNADGTGGTVLDRAHAFFGHDQPFYILGEVFGQGVQDLHYGATSPQFRVFDVYVGQPGQGRYLNYEELVRFCRETNVEMVPFVAMGGFCKEFIEQHTDGETTLDGGHIREGVVIKPIKEREHDELGRVILKSVSEKYLLRGGNATEYN